MCLSPYSNLCLFALHMPIGQPFTEDSRMSLRLNLVQHERAAHVSVGLYISKASYVIDVMYGAAQLRPF